MCELGAGEILLTSMDRDGTKVGYDIELLRAVDDAVSVPVIASGGVGTLEHLCAGATEGGATGLLAASIFHFGQFTVREAKSELAARGLTVRPSYSCRQTSPLMLAKLRRGSQQVFGRCRGARNSLRP